MPSLLNDLGRHPVRRALHRTKDVASTHAEIHVKALGAAKVDQLQDAARHNKDVSAFDVSMNDVVAMEIGHA